MKNELKAIKKEYAVPRKTEIKDEITEIKLAATDMIAKEYEISFSKQIIKGDRIKKLISM